MLHLHILLYCYWLSQGWLSVEWKVELNEILRYSFYFTPIERTSGVCIPRHDIFQYYTTVQVRRSTGKRMYRSVRKPNLLFRFDSCTMYPTAGMAHERELVE